MDRITIIILYHTWLYSVEVHYVVTIRHGVREANQGRPSIRHLNKVTATITLLYDWSRRVRVVAADRHSVTVTAKGWGTPKDREIAGVKVDVPDLSKVVTAAADPDSQRRIDHPGRRWNAYLQKLLRLLRCRMPELIRMWMAPAHRIASAPPISMASPSNSGSTPVDARRRR